jgi:hypothetical protein
MILAPGITVKRLLWVIFAALVIAAAAVLVRTRAEDHAIVSAAPATAESLPDVQVRHEFVTVSSPAASPSIAATTEPRRTTLRAAHSAAPVRAPAPRDVQRTAADHTLLDKARRAFLGDGRHRPEPFPRIRDN